MTRKSKRNPKSKSKSTKSLRRTKKPTKKSQSRQKSRRRASRALSGGCWLSDLFKTKNQFSQMLRNAEDDEYMFMAKPNAEAKNMAKPPTAENMAKHIAILKAKKAAAQKINAKNLFKNQNQDLRNTVLQYHKNLENQRFKKITSLPMTKKYY
jgi:hypothetical protein